MASRNASRTVMCTVLPVHSGSARRSGDGAAPAAAAACFAFGGLRPSALSALGAGAAAAAGAALAASATLSPSAARMQIGVLTATPSVPSSTRICATVPSSTASTSIVALSVSISQIT